MRYLLSPGSRLNMTAPGYSKKLSTQLSRFTESHMTSTTKDTMSSDQRYKYVLNFKDFKGFKKVQNVKDRYKIGRVLGEGSFG